MRLSLPVILPLSLRGELRDWGHFSRFTWRGWNHFPWKFKKRTIGICGATIQVQCTNPQKDGHQSYNVLCSFTNEGGIWGDPQDLSSKNWSWILWLFMGSVCISINRLFLMALKTIIVYWLFFCSCTNIFGGRYSFNLDCEIMQLTQLTYLTKLILYLCFYFFF